MTTDSTTPPVILSTPPLPKWAHEPKPGEVFRAPRHLLWWTVALVAMCGVMDVAAVFPSLATLHLVKQIRDGELVSPDTGEMIDLIAGLIGLVSVVFMIAAGVVFCCWMYRIHANARMVATEKPPMGPGMGVGSFFIPILCLFYPYRAARFSWQASAKAAVVDGTEAPGAGIVSAWWGTWILINTIGNVIIRITVQSNDLEQAADIGGD